MTVETTNNRKDYTSNGTVTVFPYDFVLLNESDLDVYLDGVLTASGYTVARNANDVGGNVVFAVSPGTVSVPVKVLLYRQVPITQPTGLEVESKLPSPTLEGMSDRITMIAQQLKETSDRSITLPISSLSTGLVFPDAAANKLIAWDPTGEFLVNTDGTPGPTGPAGSMTGPGTVVKYDIPLYADTTGNVLDKMGGLGTAGQIMTSNGVGNKPSMQDNVSVLHHGGRLTLSNTTPNPATDQSGSTVYLLPYLHDKTQVQVSGKWVNRTIVAQSLPISSGVFRLVDIFEYDNAGALALEALPWDSSGRLQYSVTSASKASPCVLTIGSHSLVVGDIVGIYAAAASGTVWTDVDRKLHGKKCYVSAKTGTTITLEGMDTTGLTTSNYTGVIVVKIPTAPAIGLALQDGVVVKSGDATRRFLGTLITDGDGNIVDSTAQRNLSNWYNRENARLYSNDAVSSFVSANTSSWIARDASTQIGKTRCELVTCFDQSVLVNCRETWDGTGINWFPGIGANRLDPAGTGLDFTMQVPYSLNLGSTLIMAYSKVFSRGSTFLQHMNYGNGTTGLGDTGNSNRRSGFDFIIQR